jgi:hypothetical protein
MSDRIPQAPIAARPPIGFVDPQVTTASVAGSYRRLVEMGLLRDGSLEECDVVFCEWPRYRHYRRLRTERRLAFRLNQIPVATQQIQHKKRFARHLHRRPYVPRTYLALCLRRLQGIWVEKPYNLDRAEGITFLRDPRGWWRRGHLLQRYLDDPWLVNDRKTEVRVLARISDDGSVRVHREGLVRVALRPFTLDDLDPLIHNSSLSFQRRMGVKEPEQHLLSELVFNGNLLDAMVEIVHDTVAMLREKGRFTGSDDFELIGYDFVVDRSGTPFLLEANRFPGLWFDVDVSARFYIGMLRALFHDI